MQAMRFLLALVFLALTTSMIAQETGIPVVAQEDIAAHLMVYIPPDYPPIAAAARVNGDVTVRVEIAPDGLIRTAKVVSGPPMLRQATLDAVKKWRYQPFRRGESTVAVTGDVLVRFTLSGGPTVHTPHESTATGSYSTNLTFPAPDRSGEADEDIEKRFDAPWEACSRGVIAHSTDRDTAEACKKAASVADELKSIDRAVQRRQAYVYAATAFANVRDFETALVYADKSVAVVKLGHDGNSGSEAAYSTRGQIRAFLGDLNGADEDLNVAEDFCRKSQLRAALKRDLQFHAQLLEHMNKQDEALKKTDEASSL